MRVQLDEAEFGIPALGVIVEVCPYPGGIRGEEEAYVIVRLDKGVPSKNIETGEIQDLMEFCCPARFLKAVEN